MTDENNEVEQEVQETPEIDYQAKVLELEQSMEKILNKNNELLGEKKKVQEANKALKEEELTRAKKNGDFERLLESSEAERNKAIEELTTYKQKALESKLSNKAMKIANELKAIPESIAITSELIAKELKNITDEKGDISDTALSALKQQFVNDEKYKPLLQGNLSNGGGAAGAKSGAQSKTKEMSRADFESMDAHKKMAFIKDNGKLI